MDEFNLRKAIIRTAQKFEPLGLSVGTSGNISVGCPDSTYRLITPSGIPYEHLVPDDIVKICVEDGNEIGKRKASIEKNLHLAIARARPEFTVIIHTDAENASIVTDDVPPYRHTVFKSGGPCIPFAPYATPGTSEIGDGAVRALGTRYQCCILGKHGLVACGTTLSSVLMLAYWIEKYTETWIRYVGHCADLGKKPDLLGPDELKKLEALFLTYGKE